MCQNLAKKRKKERKVEHARPRKETGNRTRSIAKAPDLVELLDALFTVVGILLQIVDGAHTLGVLPDIALVALNPLANRVIEL